MGLFKSKGEKADEFFERGSECNKGGDYHGAITNFAKAIDYYIKLDNTIGLAASCYNLAFACKKLEQWDDAAKYYGYAARYYGDLGNDHVEDYGDCHFYVGYCNAEMNKYSEALDAYILAIPLYAQCGADKDLANTYYNSANACCNLNRNNEAIDYYRKAKEIYLRLSCNDDAKDCDDRLSKLGASTSFEMPSFNSLGGASTSFDLPSFDSLGGASDEEMATKYFNTAYDASNRGDASTAIENYERSVPYYERMGNKKFLANTYFNLSINYAKVNNYNKSYENAGKAAGLYQAIGDKVNESDSYDTMATALRKIGNSREAVRYESQAIQILEGTGQKDGTLANYYYNLGNELGDIEEHSSAGESYRKAAEIYSLVNDAENEADSCYNACNRFDDAKRYQEAIQCGQRAVGIYQRIGKDDDVASCLFNMAIVAVHVNQTDKAVEYLKTSRAIYVRLGDTEHVKKIDDLLN